jgi:hypothetical protein
VSQNSPINTAYAINTSSSGYTVPVGDIKSFRTPEGLLVTRAVQTKEGWKGQIIVDKNIVWESEDGHRGEDDFEGEKLALAEANKRVVNALGDLFA